MNLGLGRNFFGRGSFHFFRREDADEAAFSAFILEQHDTGNAREERVVLAAADVSAGLERRTALAHEDAAARNKLSREALDAQALTVGIASVNR